MLDYVKYIDIEYDADSTTRANSLKTTLIRCAELMGMTAEDISESSNVIRLKIIHSLCPEDYMVWYCSNPGEISPRVNFYIELDKDTSTSTNVNDKLGDMQFQNYQNFTYYRYRFYCVQSKDGKNVAWGYANIENSSMSLNYGLMIGKDLNNDTVKGMYFTKQFIYYYENTNNRLSYEIANTNTTNLASLVMNKACVPSIGFLADSAYFPLMAYPSITPYDVSMNGKIYLFASTDGTANGRIAFEVENNKIN
ncbi:MAG: hypothetical protein J6L77_09695 [Coprococcus sp.]|nr:hypothetical protein [Coprococcus sp.]